MMTRNNPRRRLLQGLRIGPVDSGKKTGLASGRNNSAGAAAIDHLVVALVLLEKPAARERIPADRNNPSTACSHLVPDTLFVDEVHNDAERDGGCDCDHQEIKLER